MENKTTTTIPIVYSGFMVIIQNIMLRAVLGGLKQERGGIRKPPPPYMSNFSA
jgi:hypothetical protein